MHLSLWGAARIPKERSGLPVDIWVDDGFLYKYYQWERRIIYNVLGEDSPSNGSVGFITISDNPLVMDWCDSCYFVVQQLKDFVIRNRVILEQLSDMEIDHSEFLERMV